ncbi:hypothetical protein DEJ46_01240 [Streptomyces venezuelae]|uniref:Uncharacterized protein n=1 Tax=Streptomyces venezuelae TaxID=54571 RepID=A0A5P2AM02_STRVZ|nr:hypothetical protein DEJ46_01240 [Streptomyces venezuelae]
MPPGPAPASSEPPPTGPANTGSGDASGVTVTLPAGVYYSRALDLGTGPKPSSVTLNRDGTRTLVWNVGAVPANSGELRIVFTARPTLLALAGTTYTDTGSVSYRNAGGACTFAPVTDSATTSTDRDGALSVSEGTAAFNGSNAPKSILGKQLLTVYFNLATRRINAGTEIRSRTARSLGLDNVREAVIYAQDTLLLPVNSGTSPRYSGIIGVLDDVNANRIEVHGESSANRSLS